MLVFFVPLKYILLLKKGKSVTIAGKKLQHIDSVRRFGPLSREDLSRAIPAMTLHISSESPPRRE